MFVGIAAYNEGQNLPKLLQDVVADPVWTTTDAICGVVNDGSHDETRAVIRSAQQSLGTRLIALEHPARMGKCAALNTLASAGRQAGAEVLAFIDGDVRLQKSCLMELLHATTAVQDQVVTGAGIPDLTGLTFPLREYYMAKMASEVYRAQHRIYINGRIFAMRGIHFPQLPEELRMSDDRYLTMLFGKHRIRTCALARVVYAPPKTIISHLRQRIVEQRRLIRLSRVAPHEYRRLKNRRFTFFHTYYWSYPVEDRSVLLSRMNLRIAMAVLAERQLSVAGKLLGEVLGESEVQ